MAPIIGNNPMPSIEMLEARKSEIVTDLEKLISTAESFNRGFSSGEITKQAALTKDLKAVSKKLKGEREALDLRNRVSKELQPFSLNGSGQFFTSGNNTYGERSENGYFHDLFTAGTGDSGARERLDRHGREFRDFARTSNIPEIRASSTTAGAGGDFAPPVYLMDQYIAAVRPARATANAISNQQLPPNQDLINVPKILTGTAVAQQVANNTTVNIQDITTSTVAAPVLTVAGGMLISQQLFDQSPLKGMVDQLILRDLLSDYARQLGTLVINGTGVGVQPTGLLTAAGTPITYTDATPGFMGPGKLYAQIGKAIQAVQTTRFLSPTVISMHPRRFAWMAVQVDSANRAVILPTDNGPLNASGLMANGNAEGYVGTVFGLPVIVDPNIPINLGAGTNQDPIIVMKADDSVLYEGTLKAEVFRETYSNTLSLFCRVYNYFALAHRLPQSIAVINGTGLVTPTF
jgi:HK97 family phage major capsid protein